MPSNDKMPRPFFPSDPSQIPTPPKLAYSLPPIPKIEIKPAPIKKNVTLISKKTAPSEEAK